MGNRIIFVILLFSLTGLLLPPGFVEAQSNAIMPDWFKNNAKWWKEGLIDDTTMINSLESLMIQDIIPLDRFITSSPGIEHQSGVSKGGTLVQIPSYQKDVFGLWSNGIVSDGEIVNSIGYLMNEGIINSEKIQIEITERKEKQNASSSSQFDKRSGCSLEQFDLEGLPCNPIDKAELPKIVSKFSDDGLTLYTDTTFTIDLNVTSEIRQKIVESNELNYWALTILQGIKNYEYEVIQQSEKQAWNTLSNTKDKQMQDLAIFLRDALPPAKEDAKNAASLHQNAKESTEQSRKDAIQNGVTQQELDDITRQNMARFFDDVESVNNLNQAYDLVDELFEKRDKSLLEIIPKYYPISSDDMGIIKPPTDDELLFGISIGCDYDSCGISLEGTNDDSTKKSKVLPIKEIPAKFSIDGNDWNGPNDFGRALGILYGGSVDSELDVDGNFYKVMNRDWTDYQLVREKLYDYNTSEKETTDINPNCVLGYIFQNNECVESTESVEITITTGNVIFDSASYEVTGEFILQSQEPFVNQSVDVILSNEDGTFEMKQTFPVDENGKVEFNFTPGDEGKYIVWIDNDWADILDDGNLLTVLVHSNTAIVNVKYVAAIENGYSLIWHFINPVTGEPVSNTEVLLDTYNEQKNIPPFNERIQSRFTDEGGWLTHTINNYANSVLWAGNWEYTIIKIPKSTFVETPLYIGGGDSLEACLIAPPWLEPPVVDTTCLAPSTNPLTDSDEDGISDNIDTKPNEFSDEFFDEDPSGLVSGKIVDRNGNSVKVWKEGDTIQIISNGEGGEDNRAIISLFGTEFILEPITLIEVDFG